MDVNNHLTQGAGALPQTVFKLVLIGSNQVGKSTYLRQYPTEEIQPIKVCGADAEIYTIRLDTSVGPVVFNIWQLVGLEEKRDEYGALKAEYDEFFLGAHAAMIMFDTTNRQSYKDVPQWFRSLVRVCESIPAVLVGNKVDQKDRKVKPRSITFHRKKNLQYYDVSALTQYNYERPLLWLTRRLIGDPYIVLNNQLPLKEPQQPQDCEYMKHIAEEWENAGMMPLQDLDD